jgi:RNA polymerase sigma factor (sigma-70 family)
MPARSETLLRYLRRLARHTEPSEASDAVLLGRFIAERDERAFAALVDRHAALVLQVCRRVLGDTPDAQDAFQATFLVLARKAATVHPRDALPAWLHGVARRVALKTRSARARRLRDGPTLATPPIDPRPGPLAELSARELLAIVDEEVGRLAEVYRLPVILCCLEGRSREEAAQQLGWTPGSVKGRLERGRAILHERLVRRGLTLAAALAAVELSRGAASAALIARLADPTVLAALAFAARRTPTADGVSAKAIDLARHVIQSMALDRLKRVAMLLLAVGVLTVGWAAQRKTEAPLMTALDDRSASFSSAEPDRVTVPTTPGEIEARIEVSGIVLDPNGRPLAGAKLYVGYAPRRSEPEAIAHLPIYPLRAISGTEGRFRFAFSRADLDERYLDASRPVVIAVADGFGLNWTDIGGPGERAVRRVRLVEDAPLEGRILDPDRRPVVGAKIHVRQLSGGSAAGLTRYLQHFDPDAELFTSCRGPLPGQPPQVTTDADGRFRLTGVGRDRIVTLAVEGPAGMMGGVTVVTRPAAAVSDTPFVRGVPFDYVASAPRPIRGVVRDKQTGALLAGVRISTGMGGPTTLTDAQGRYELFDSATRLGFAVTAQPQSGQPYLAAEARLPRQTGLEALTADLELVGGLPVCGRVIDRTTGRPPKRATVEYYPLYSNAHSAALTVLNRLTPVSCAVVQPDGAYRLTVLPGPGVVLVAASPRDSYAAARLDKRELANLFNDGKHHGSGSWIYIAPGARGISDRCVDRYNALALIKPDDKAQSLALDFTLEQAPPVPGTVVGPDGQPVVGARVVGLTSMPDVETLQGASFTIEGLNPRRTRRLTFYHREKGLAKDLTIRGDQTKELTVQLEPCGVVCGRTVDRAGHPLAGVVISCGNPEQHLRARAETESDGRFRVPLVPGLKYGLVAEVAGNRLKTQDEARKDVTRLGEFEVESGQTKDLGDLSLGP